jgi:hypothetical protein
MGGIGAGMICLEGAGSLTHVSVRDQPGPEPARLLRGDLDRRPRRRSRAWSRGRCPVEALRAPARVQRERPLGSGLPRFEQATFRAHFPFARVELEDPALPDLGAHHGLEPVRARGRRQLEPARRGPGVHVHAPRRRGARRRVLVQRPRNFLPARWTSGTAPEPEHGGAHPGGFVLYGGPGRRPSRRRPGSPRGRRPGGQGEPGLVPRGWFDPLTMAWRDVEQGAAYDRPVPAEGNKADGGLALRPVPHGPRASKTIRLRLAWYSPRTRIRDARAADRRTGTAVGLLPALVRRALREHRRARRPTGAPTTRTCGAARGASPTASSTRPCPPRRWRPPRRT